MILPGSPKMMIGVKKFDPDTPFGTLIEGGYYLGTIMDSGDNYALFVAPKATGQSPTDLEWTEQAVTTGITSTTNGPGNTASLIGSSISYPAALYCVGLSIDGYSDWYLPASGELLAVNPNRLYLPSGEDYDDVRYWSSTEASGANANFLNPLNGTINTRSKTSKENVRAMRRIKI